MAWPSIDRWLGGPHESELAPMDWEQLDTLAAAGWEIGSHTVSHPKLSELGDDRLAEELGESKTACEEALEVPCTSVAYPIPVVRASAGQSLSHDSRDIYHRAYFERWQRRIDRETTYAAARAGIARWSRRGAYSATPR